MSSRWMVAACGWAHKDGICNCHQPWRLAPDDVRVGQPVASQDRPGIDVDRLSEAIFNATTSRGHAEHDSEECETCRWFRTLSNEAADDAAREYARLSEHPDTGDASQP